MTTALLSLLGGGQAVNPLMVFGTSSTFTPAVTGVYDIYVLGAGGSGAAFTYGNAGANVTATGGAAGGFAIKRATLTGGVTYTITVGAGGVGRSVAAAAGASLQAGLPGGASSFSGASFTTITANGGAGGTGIYSSATIAASAGGTANGGDTNVTGGSGGGGSGLASSSTSVQASGGGAPGIFGTGRNSGNIFDSSISGGASPGGASYGASSFASGGGGNGGPSSSLVIATGTGTGGPDIFGQYGFSCFDGNTGFDGPFDSNIFNLTAGGGQAYSWNQTNPGDLGIFSRRLAPGSASGAARISALMIGIASMKTLDAGIFAGTGAATVLGAISIGTGNAGAGAGSGAAAGCSTGGSGGPAVTGNGGNGLVILQKVAS